MRLPAPNLVYRKDQVWRKWRGVYDGGNGVVRARLGKDPLMEPLAARLRNPIGQQKHLQPGNGNYTESPLPNRNIAECDSEAVENNKAWT